jgi:phage tail sheath protein FI
MAIGARPVKVSATEPIAIVLTSNEVDKNEMFYFDSLDKALNYFVEAKEINGKTRTFAQVKEGIKNGTIKGNLFKYLVWAANKYELIVPIIVSVAKWDKDGAKLKTNVINAIADIKKVPAKFHLRPDIIAVADYTSDIDIAKQYIATLDILRARGFIDLKAKDGSDAKGKREQFGSYRVTPVYTDLVDWNTLIDKQDTFSANFILSVFRCVVDGSDTTRGVGWSYSLSNKTLPVAEADADVDFILGLGDETDLLTNNQITSFIAFNGIRVWNYQTCSADPLLQDACRVRIFDKLTFAVLPAIFPFIDSDRGVKAIKEAKDTIRAFVADMVAKEVLLGGEIELDTELTSPTAITAGEFYFKVNTQENPKPVKIAVEFNRVDAYAPVVYKIVG